MPKVGPEDHRPARAVLHAPYPLPFIITRQPAPSAPPPSIRPLTPVQRPLALAPASLTDFPTFHHDWRAQSPAFPPVPYPNLDSDRDEHRRERRKRLQLLKMRRRDAESSEWEMMSGVEMDEGGRDSNHGLTVGEDLLKLTKQVGKISAGEGGTDEEDSNMDENNLLIYAFVSSFERGHFDSPPSESSPKTPTQAIPFPVIDANDHYSAHDHELNQVVRPHGENEGFSNQSTPKPILTTAHPEPIKPSTPAWDVVSDALSSFWSDGTDDEHADEEDQETPSPHNLVTPSASASRLSKRLKNQHQNERRSTDRPLFLGQTNQAPFTYTPPPRRLASQSSVGDSTVIVAGRGRGGYTSEAGSVRTVRQIPRSKVNRMKLRGFDNGKGKGKEKERSVTPKQRDYQPQTFISVNPPTAPLDSSSHPSSLAQPAPMLPFFTPSQPHPGNMAVVHPPQPSMAGLESFTFAPIAPLLRTSEVLSSPTDAGPNREASWSPQPMSIDPRTTESAFRPINSGFSWPHPLPAREQLTPPNASSLMKHIAETTSSDADVPMPTAQSRLGQPYTYLLAQATHMSRKAHRRARPYPSKIRSMTGMEMGGDEGLPIGKACHNYLFLRKRSGAKKQSMTSNNDHNTINNGMDLDTAELEGKGQAWNRGGRGSRTHPRIQALLADERLDPPAKPVNHTLEPGRAGLLAHTTRPTQSAQSTNANHKQHPTWFPSSSPWNLNASLTPHSIGGPSSDSLQQPMPMSMIMPYHMGLPMGWYPQFNAEQGWPPFPLVGPWNMGMEMHSNIGQFMTGNLNNGNLPQAGDAPTRSSTKLNGANESPSNTSQHSYNLPWFGQATSQTQDQTRAQTLLQRQQVPGQNQWQSPWPWTTQSYEFPTPGPSPQAHPGMQSPLTASNPAALHGQGPRQTPDHTPSNPTWVAMTSQSPEQLGEGDRVEGKPQRKRRRSVSPSSAHANELLRLFGNEYQRSASHDVASAPPNPQPTSVLNHLTPPAQAIRPQHSSIKNARSPSRGVGAHEAQARILGFHRPQVKSQSPSAQANGLLAPAQIRNSFSPSYVMPKKEPDLETESEGDSAVFDRAIFDLGLNHSRRSLGKPTVGDYNGDRVHDEAIRRDESGYGRGRILEGANDEDDGGETEVERVGRRDKWVDEQAQMQLRNKRGKSVGNGIGVGVDMGIGVSVGISHSRGVAEGSGKGKGRAEDF